MEQGHQKTKMKSFLTSYSQLSLLNPLRSRIENRCCHEPTYLLKTGLLSLNCLTTCCFAPRRCNRFTCGASKSASTANFSSKEGTQNSFIDDLKEKPLHQDKHAKREGKPFYPKCFPLSENSSNPKNITAKEKFSVLAVRKRFPLGKEEHYYVPSNKKSNKQIHKQSNQLPSAYCFATCFARSSVPPHQDGQQIRKEEIGAKRNTLSTHLCNKRTILCSEKIPASAPLGGKKFISKPIKQSTGIKLLDTTPRSDLPARLGKSFSVHRTCQFSKRVFEKSLLPEKFINLLMANGEKDKARRCLTQALFSITTHCQKHNLQNNSPLRIFTDSFFKQESTESKESTADNSLQRTSLGTVQQETFSNELLPLLPKGKSNTFLGSRTQVASNNLNQVQIDKLPKQKFNPGKSVNVLRDVGLVLLESRLDNLVNGRYSDTKKRKLYPSVKESQGLLSQFNGVGTSIFRLNHIERVEKRLLSKQNGFFSFLVKQKRKLVGVGLHEKQTDKFKIPLSLPFCGKSFQTTGNVFLPLAWHAKQNNPFLSLIRLSLKEKFLISEKGFASLALHKKVQQSYLCSALLHLVQTTCSTCFATQGRNTSKGNEKRYQTLPTRIFTCCATCQATSQARKGRKAIKVTKYRTYTTTLPWFGARLLKPSLIAWHVAQHVKQQIHFLPFLPYSTLFNWREKGLNPLFGFAKQSQRFLLELCKFSANRSVKGTEKVRQNNLFGSFPLLSCFYSARTPSSPFSCVPTPSIITRNVDTNENNPVQSMCKAKANKSTCYKDEYVQQDTKLETKGLDRFIADLALHQDNLVPQNDSHSNTKDKKTPLCFTQGIPPLAKKSQEKDTKSVHTGVLLKGIQRVQPTLEVRRVRKGRNTFQVPSVVKQKRGEKVGIKWIIDSARRSKRKNNKLFSDSLANQLVESFDRLGEARSKRNELLKLAESNRPFLRFRWW